jgi:hypothetical protein
MAIEPPVGSSIVLGLYSTEKQVASIKATALRRDSCPAARECGSGSLYQTPGQRSTAADERDVGEHVGRRSP